MPLLLVSLLAAGCAGARHGAARDGAGRVRFASGRAEAVFLSAVRTVSTAGQQITICDADRPSLATRAVEIDAPCGATTCLARQWTGVVLGYRAVKVTINREYWDHALRAWVPAGPEPVRPDAQALADAIVANAGLPSKGMPRPADDACAQAVRTMVAQGR